MNTIFIVLPILTLLMFDLGLALRPADFRLLAERPKAVFVGLTGQILLLPLIAWAVASGFHLAPLFFLGVMLIACSPGGSSSNVFSMLAGRQFQQCLLHACRWRCRAVRIADGL